MAVVVQAVDVYRVSREVLVPVYAQHADGIGYGAHTGWVLPEAVKEAGAMGALINHSEKKIRMEKSEVSLDLTIKRCKEVGLKTVVCGEDVEEVEEILELNPDFVAYEPPELIGGRVSVSSAKPEVVSKVLELAGQEKVLIGAGVNSGEDVRVGLELGVFGFLIASAVMKAKDPEVALRELVKGYG
jgi:triosephosphate isomerase